MPNVFVTAHSHSARQGALDIIYMKPVALTPSYVLWMRMAALLSFLKCTCHSLVNSNVRRIEGDYLSQRRVSLYIKEDYIRERMLNTITDTLKEFMPKGMLGEGITKYGIKL